MPADGPGWIDQLELLTSQLSAPDPIADQHLDQLAAALRTALAAVVRRGRWRDSARDAWRY
ncbi:MAG: hypothetical protein ACTHMS_16745 [Jatrophihabitans sp.]|uniref:hypothetical protein n=1 Tax=Jatrophihabitans sp. TaxID=1932789 RepID=UPI003F7DDE74